MKRYAVFYHIWTSRDPLVARLLVDEQLKRLIRTGLREVADVYCAVSGGQYEVLEPVLNHHKWVKVLETDCPRYEYEFGTLKYLYSITKENPQYEAVMYFHTKGLIYYAHFETIPGQPNMCAVNSWRHYMEYFVMDRWQEAVGFLDHHDAAGCALVDGPFIHYPGNFWWAKRDYILQLDDPRVFMPEGDDRIEAERWLGSKAELSRFKILAGLSFPEGADLSNPNFYYTDTEFSYVR